MKLLNRDSNNVYVDLVISESKPSVFKRLTRNYRVCTLSSRGKQQTINLQLPRSVQEKIVTAYSEGKIVRIFA